MVDDPLVVAEIMKEEETGGESVQEIPDGFPGVLLPSGFLFPTEILENPLADGRGEVPVAEKPVLPLLCPYAGPHGRPALHAFFLPLSEEEGKNFTGKGIVFTGSPA
jgi:hypothetical protein